MSAVVSIAGETLEIEAKLKNTKKRMKTVLDDTLLFAYMSEDTLCCSTC